MTGLQLDGSKIHHHMEALARWKRGPRQRPPQPARARR